MRPRFCKSSPLRNSVLRQKSQTTYSEVAERKATGAPQDGQLAFFTGPA
ncbi:MAG: hypothetical protein IPN78_19055 [Candidatus Accumulibacter sp.]|jgi:hypothetical protein|nr:hypothetical protein [Candidatus Accumulibacter propinquus]